MNNLFTYFTQKNAPFYFPGAAFFLGALFMLSSVLISYNVFTRERHQPQAI
jgi:MFS transporter, DHA1 family, tetracycline resistance protein